MLPNRGWVNFVGRAYARAVSVVVLIVVAPASGQVVRFVNAQAAAGGDGQSWRTAYNDLHSALADTAAEQLWVATGTYKPAPAQSDRVSRAASFVLRDGLAIYGGFNGIETSLDQRDIGANPTVLSGDLNDDDGTFTTYFPPPAWLGDNSFNVITAIGGSARLDGLTITGGGATGANADIGGGLFTHNAALIVERCTFTRNYARTRAGAIYLAHGSHATIRQCQFIANQVIEGYAADAGGGAIGCSSSELIVEDCVFEENSNILVNYYSGGGGAIACYSSPLTVTGSSFEHNQGGYYGASIYLQDGTLELSACHFSENSARWGNVYCRDSEATVRDCEFRDMLMEGGCGVRMYGGTLEVRSCLFEQLSAGDLGGGLALNAASALITECDFVGCRAGPGFEGGAIYMGPGTDATMVNCRFLGNYNAALWSNSHVAATNSLTAINCLFSGNFGSIPGGAIELRAASWSGPGEIGPTLIANCTFANNQTYDQIGGAISARDPGTVVIHNSILVHNGPNQLATVEGAIITPTFCMIEGGYPGEGNIASANAGFVDENGPDNLVGTIDDDLRLIASSFCIDAGRNSDVPPDIADLDVDGDFGEPTPLDLAFGPRFYELGAAPNTGQGSPPIVDMGCYEFHIECLGDVNHTGAVDVDDLIIVVMDWGWCPFFPIPCPGDANGSGTVNVDDLIAVILNWGACP